MKCVFRVQHFLLISFATFRIFKRFLLPQNSGIGELIYCKLYVGSQYKTFSKIMNKSVWRDQNFCWVDFPSLLKLQVTLRQLSWWFSFCDNYKPVQTDTKWVKILDENLFCCYGLLRTCLPERNIRRLAVSWAISLYFFINFETYNTDKNLIGSVVYGQDEPTNCVFIS